jgi:hypothetical protein
MSVAPESSVGADGVLLAIARTGAVSASAERPEERGRRAVSVAIDLGFAVIPHPPQLEGTPFVAGRRVQ